MARPSLAGVAAAVAVAVTGTGTTVTRARAVTVAVPWTTGAAVDAWMGPEGASQMTMGGRSGGRSTAGHGGHDVPRLRASPLAGDANNSCPPVAEVRCHGCQGPSCQEGA